MCRRSPPELPEGHRTTMANRQEELPRCSICLDELRLGEGVHAHDPAVGTGCLFHRGCIQSCLSSGIGRCPNCRAPITAPVENPIYAHCATFRDVAAHQLTILAALLGTVVLASCAALDILFVVVPEVGQNTGLEVRRGRFVCDRYSRCRPIDEAAVKLPADRPTTAFDLVVIASVVIICICIVYGCRIWQELLSQFESMVVEVNQDAARIVNQEGQNAGRQATLNANQAHEATTRAIVVAAHLAAREVATNAAGATDRHAAGEAAARAEVCGLRSRNQTLESQLKISGAENEVLAARVEEEATAREAAEAQAAETECRRLALAARVKAALREAEKATAALAAEIERRTEPPAEQDENVPSPPKVKRSFSFRLSFPRSFSVSSREERPSRYRSTRSSSYERGEGLESYLEYGI